MDFEIVTSNDLPAEIIVEGIMGPPGPPGPQGPAGQGGSSSLGNYPIEITNASPSDLLQLSSDSKWVNSPLVDGGNF